MATMYDSVTGDACPTNAPVVGGYVDGAYGPNDPYGSGWSAAAWARYPNSQHVTITVQGSPGARAADCESGAMTPQQTATWALNEVHAGRRPTVYADEWDWYNVVDPHLTNVGLRRGVNVDGWIAWEGHQGIPAGFVALQNQQNVPGENGHNMDVGVTNDLWPSNSQPTPPPPSGPTPPPVPLAFRKPLSGKYGTLNAPAVAICPTLDNKGYTIVGSDGGTFDYGTAQHYGSLANIHLNAPIIDAVRTRTGNGLYMVGTDGGVFAFGDAHWFGSLGGMKLNQPVVGMALTKSGNGYYLVAADGGVFCFGDAAFHGSTGSMKLNQPIVGMAVTPSGNGYWLGAADGGIFTFGDAPFLGSMGGKTLNDPVVALAGCPTSGYWLTGTDGGIFSFGAPFEGSTGSIKLNAQITDMYGTTTGNGYWLLAADGGVFTFGDASFEGSPA